MVMASTLALRLVFPKLRHFWAGRYRNQCAAQVSRLHDHSLPQLLRHPSLRDRGRRGLDHQKSLDVALLPVL
jgi:hypothetical protein